MRPHEPRRGTAWRANWAAGLLLVAGLLGATLITPAPAAASSAVRSDESDAIDAWVEERMAAHGVPGAAVAAVRGGQVVHLAGYGTADEAGRAVAADTPFILAR